AAGGEEHAVEVAGCETRQALGQLGRLGVGVGPEREVRQLLRLLGGGLGQLGASVTDLDDEETRQSVEVALAVDVVDVGALTADDGGDLGLLVGAVPGEVQPQVVPRCVQDVMLRLRHVYLPLSRSAHQCATSPATLPSDCVATPDTRKRIRRTFR